MNATMTKFGYPKSLIREYNHWVVLLRPQQTTLGALVLISKESVDSLSGISVEAFSELKEITTIIESSLKDCFTYDKINYLMLMMIDPDVHFHVLPRYSTSRMFGEAEFIDPGWPGPPDLSKANEVGDTVKQQIRELLKNEFSSDSTVSG